MGKSIQRMSVTVSLMLAIACSGSERDTDAGPSKVGDSTPQAYVVKGVVKDSRGQPIEGAEIVADNTQQYDDNAVGSTNTKGAYRLELKRIATTWSVSGSIQREYHGRNYQFDLHPLKSAAFAGSEGAVRDLEWRLKGAKPDNLGNYGGYVAVYGRLGDGIIETDVELTLVPDGPLVDGSTGDDVSGKLVSSPDGYVLDDVPVGRYTATARYAPEGQQSEPLLIRVRNTGSYQSSVTFDFEQLGSLSIHLMELEVATASPAP